MGDVGGLGGDGENGVATGEREEQQGFLGGAANMTTRRNPGPGPDPLTISEECWAVGEEAAQEVLKCFHPTLDSEEKRKDVIDYIQRLIRDSLGCEVFPYGSVPLKTYLPDGDIDLTALGSLDIDEFLPKEVLRVLQEEERNANAEYQVKDTQFIDAEVKLVKCLVQNIVVDISFNQLGGLCSLCFLEQVDRLVGKDHFFKRSILLIKAWCYYESRILGAHHGLMSTYALETLVLYIFRFFHSSLNGPLAVLYRFLDYFSKFDWDKYCISLQGPVCKSTLPNIVVHMPIGGNDLMLSEEYLWNCMEMFSVPSRDQETSSRTFQTKHLNIIDPLKEYNNLGRSVHRGNFYRVRSAFKYGARKLGRILSLPGDRVADEIKSFYANTLERHGSKDGCGMQKPILLFGAAGSLTFSCSSPGEMLSEDDMLLTSSSCDLENDCLGKEENCTSVLTDELRKYPGALNSSHIVSENYLADGDTFSGNRILGDGNDDLSCSSSVCADGTSDYPSNHPGSLSGFHGCQLCRLNTCAENGEPRFGNLCQIDSSESIDSNTCQSCVAKLENCSKGSAVSSPRTDILRSLSIDFAERDLTSDAEPLNPLSDLTGDYDSHIRSLLYGQCCHGFAFSAPGLPNSPLSPSRWTKKPWDAVGRAKPLRQNSFPQNNLCTAYSGSPQEGPAYPSLYGPGFNVEDRCKARGTGTYIPIMNSFSGDRPLPGGRFRCKAPGIHSQLQRHTPMNGLGLCSTVSPRSYSKRCSFKDPRPQSSVDGKSGVSQQSHYCAGDDTCVNGFSNTPFRLQFGSIGNLPEVLFSDSPRNWGSTPGFPVQIMGSNSVQGEQQERGAAHGFHLRNEDEFPALS